LRKLGEDITETLEYVPARFKVIQHVRKVVAAVADCLKEGRRFEQAHRDWPLLKRVSCATKPTLD